MHELTWYHQKREDGGIRTAVTIDDETVLHHFEPGPEPSDPVLIWIVELRCKGTRLPTTPVKALQWLRNQADVVRAGLTSLADKLEVGMDFDVMPLQWPIPHSPRGVRMTLVCSAMRRLDLLRIATILRDVRDHWEEILGQLDVPQPTRLVEEW